MTRLLALLVLFTVAVQAPAQQYPAKPIKLVVGYPPGGSGDFLSRLAADELGKELGVAVVVENKPGAAGNIAHELVARSAADGYTVLNAAPMAVNRALYQHLTYDPDKDFAAVTRIATGPTVICVNNAVPINSLRQLIAYARQNPGKLFHASAGAGSAPHLAAVLFESVAGVKFTHVQFKGGGPATQSLLAGDTQVNFATAPTVMGFVRAGRLRALAVSSRHATPAAPGIPGAEEAAARGDGEGAGEARGARKDRAAGHGCDPLGLAGRLRGRSEEGNALLGEAGARIRCQGGIDAARHAMVIDRQCRGLCAGKFRNVSGGRVRALAAGRLRVALRALAAPHLQLPACESGAHLLQHAGAVHVRRRDRAAVRLALLHAVLLCLRGGGGALPSDRHGGHGRAAGADGRRLGRYLWSAARLRRLLSAPAGDAALPADPDAGARVRVRLRGARAAARHHPDRGRGGALRASRRHAGGLADDPVAPARLSVSNVTAVEIRRQDAR